MKEEIERFLTEMAEEIARGESEKIFDRFALPTILYVVGKIIVIESREQFTEILATYTRELEQASMQGKLMKVNDVSREKNGRVVAFVTGIHLGKDGKPHGASLFKYFFRSEDGELKIEMIELCDFPDDGVGFGDPLLKIAQ